jgi:hypothetical protein
MDITVYLPDDLGKWAKEHELGLSRMLREAVEEEKKRHDARAKITEEGFERVEAYDGERDREVAFQGRQIGYADHWDQTAYLTPKNAIAVYSAERQELWIYDDYQEFLGNPDEPNHPDEMTAQVAAALGEKYVEELDI